MVRIGTTTTATTAQTTVVTVACNKYAIRATLAFRLCYPWSQVRIRFRFKLPILKDSESQNDAQYSHLQQKPGACVPSAFCESAAKKARNVREARSPVLLRASLSVLHKKFDSVAEVNRTLFDSGHIL